MYHPRVVEWLAELVALRDGGTAGVTLPYMASIITRGCRAEGIIGPDDTVGASAVGECLRRKSRG